MMMMEASRHRRMYPTSYTNSTWTLLSSAIVPYMMPTRALDGCTREACVWKSMATF